MVRKGTKYNEKQVHKQIKHNEIAANQQKFLGLCILIAACIIDEIPHLRISNSISYDTENK